MRDETSGAAASSPTTAPEPPRALSPAALRALAEAKARREAAATAAVELPREVDGRAGPEPTRFGDWERNGILSDF